MARVLIGLLLAIVSASSLADRQPHSPSQPLAGPWTVSVGRSPKSLQAGARSVRLPYVVNATGFTGRRGLISFRGSVAWFRKDFIVPSDGPYVLQFGSVHHRATVWLDSRLVRRHVGAYLPFEVRATLSAGRRHTLVALRSLFAHAKKTNAIFRNPTSHIKVGHQESGVLQPLRPEHLQLCDPHAGVLRGALEDTVFLGDQARCDVRLEDGEHLRVRAGDEAEPRAGDRVGVAVRPGCGVVMAADEES